MLFPATTAIFAAVLALVYASMTVWVMASRTSNGTLQGDGGNEGLQNRIRAHGFWRIRAARALSRCGCSAVPIVVQAAMQRSPYRGHRFPPQGQCHGNRQHRPWCAGIVTGTESERQSGELGPEAHAAVAASHVTAASARNWRRVRRETRWRWVLNVLWTAAWADKKRWADPGDLKRCILRSRLRVG